MVKKAGRLVVQGTVQGVFFRQFVKENADNLKLTGFVRNLTGGDVEIIVEGEPEQIDRLAGMVKKGPEHSQIRHVQIEERKWSGAFKEFKILRF
jgi:acylphosphatase